MEHKGLPKAIWIQVMDDGTMLKVDFKTSTQWRSAIRATVAVSRFRRLMQSARQQGRVEPEQLEPEYQNQNVSPREDGEIHSQASHNEEANQGAQLDPDALDKTLEDKNPEVEVVKLIRDELVKQLDAYGIVLVLLAGITFVAILQPPGSFEKGKLHESLLVSLFMLLATLSFFIACTALGAVMVGCAELFRPFFHTKLAKYTDCLPVENGLTIETPASRGFRNWLLGRWEIGLTTETPASRGFRNWLLGRWKIGLTTETPASRGFRNWLLGCWEIGPNYVAFDNINVLAELCVENVYRIRRIRFYLGVALVLCIAAYICGALAVMVTNDRQRYMLAGAMGAGGVILLCEICITLSTTLKPVSKSIDVSLQPRLQQQLRDFTNRYDGHPHIQTLP